MRRTCGAEPQTGLVLTMVPTLEWTMSTERTALRDREGISHRHSSVPAPNPNDEGREPEPVVSVACSGRAPPFRAPRPAPLGEWDSSLSLPRVRPTTPVGSHDLPRHSRAWKKNTAGISSECTDTGKDQRRLRGMARTIGKPQWDGVPMTDRRSIHSTKVPPQYTTVETALAKKIHYSQQTSRDCNDCHLHSFVECGRHINYGRRQIP